MVIRKCLDSIFRSVFNFSREIIVIDNGSSDKTREIVEEFDEIKLVENKKNLGFAKANNQGIKIAQGRFVLFLNQDIELKEGVVEGMFNYLKNNIVRKVAAVSPKLVYPTGKLQLSLRPFPTPGNVFLDTLTFGSWHRNYYNYDKNQSVDQPMFSCIMIEREVLKKTGGFDENPHFFLYFNDVDLSFRINKLGFSHYYLAQQSVIHHHGQGASKWLEISRLKAWHRGLYYFLIKHYAKEQFILRLILKGEVFFIFLCRLLANAVSIRGKKKSLQ